MVKMLKILKYHIKKVVVKMNKMILCLHKNYLLYKHMKDQMFLKIHYNQQYHLQIKIDLPLIMVFIKMIKKHYQKIKH